MRTSELIDPALDWAAAKCEGLTHPEHNSYYAKGRGFCIHGGTVYSPSTDWSQGGPIIERELLTIDTWMNNGEREWYAVKRKDGEVMNPREHEAFGPTPLIAAMRCYVASKLGDEVDIPKELK